MPKKKVKQSPGPPPPLETYFHKGFLGPQESEALMACLMEQCAPYMVKYNESWRSTVATRPKCNMAEPVDGAWPVYSWGQVAEDLSLIEAVPPSVASVARTLAAQFGYPPGFLRSLLANLYYDGKDHRLVNL